MIIEYLAWDSIFFDIKIGKVLIRDNEDFNPTKFQEIAKKENYELIYVFTFSKPLSSLQIKEANLELVDIMLTMSKEFIATQYKKQAYNLITDLTKKELEECYYIAEQTAKVSRFYKEKKIGPEKTKALYRKWIDNALNQTFSDGILVEKENEKIIGIHLIKTDDINKIGRFTLTGVNRNNKRMGTGQKLWFQSFSLWGDKINKIVSPFSFQNKESFNFHLKMGFNKIEETKYIYHFRNN